MKPTLWHYEFAYVEFVASDISPKVLTAIIGQLPELSDIHVTVRLLDASRNVSF